MRKPTTAAPAPIAPVSTKPVRTVGTSSLACTIRQHRHRYEKATLANGRTTTNNGDPVAKALLGVELLALRAFCLREFGKDYSERNPGHERMCCGNVLRAAFRKGNRAVASFLGLDPSEAAAVAIVPVV